MVRFGPKSTKSAPIAVGRALMTPFTMVWASSVYFSLRRFHEAKALWAPQPQGYPYLFLTLSMALAETPSVGMSRTAVSMIMFSIPAASALGTISSMMGSLFELRRYRVLWVRTMDDLSLASLIAS